MTGRLITSYSDATAVTSDDRFLGLDGSSTKHHTPNAVSKYVAARLGTFNVADYATIHDAYTALVANGGGVLVVRGTVPVATSFVMSSAVPCVIDGYGGTLAPASSVIAISMEVGPSDIPLVSVEGLTIDGTARANGATGIRIKGHLSAVLRDVIITDCATGVLITDSASTWSESSDLDNVRIDNCTVGIDVAVNGGTGSFGYAAWGRVAIYNVPTSGIGFRVGAGAFLYHFDIAMLVIQTTAATGGGETATLMEVRGVIARSSSIGAVFESSGGAFSGTRNGLSIISGSVLDGLSLRIYWQGTFTNKILNPSAIAYQLRETNDRDVKGNSTAQNLAAYWVFGDAQPRTIMRAGRVMIGDGTASPDCAIVRWGADLIGPDSGDSWRVDGTWNGGTIRLGNFRLWVDGSGVLRIKGSAPASDTDGTVVGTQT